MIKNTYLPEGAIIRKAENREYISSYQGLEKAMREGKILEGVVTLCDSDTYTLHLDLGGVDGIIRRDECLYGEKAKDIAIITRVGKPVCFKVMELTTVDGKETAILSRKEAQRECFINYISSLSTGDIIPAVATHFEPFGAFMDIGCGIVALMTVDCVSVSRISNPSERFSIREQLYVAVKSIDREHGRIYVSTKELFGTWEENAELFSPGQTVSGVVRSVEEYGIFVELAPNLAGLAEYRDGIYEGQCCAVYIKSIIPDKMKVKLVIIDAYDFSPDLKSPTYFIDPEKTKRLTYWRYSPESCKKLVETVF
ncbi:MAG: 30S ribosomal protein S1 [Clostridia bacterium]|nr:30S ribosomal protein S1 [Clostridia bacterium]